jgi:hypothetical protein
MSGPLSTTRAAGGAGGGGGGGTPGSVVPTAGVNGTTNTGGGAGGGGNAGGTGALGGSGIVILRYLGAQRGVGGDVVTSGGYTYHTFTSSNTITF